MRETPFLLIVCACKENQAVPTVMLQQWQQPCRDGSRAVTVLGCHVPGLTGCTVQFGNSARQQCWQTSEQGCDTLILYTLDHSYNLRVAGHSAQRCVSKNTINPHKVKNIQ